MPVSPRPRVGQEARLPAAGRPRHERSRARRARSRTAAARGRAAALATKRAGEELVFGRTPSDTFVPSTVRSRAIDAWSEAGIEPIKLHDCRHSFASTLIESGITNAKAIQQAMGHASITMTYDLYGHLLPGSRDEVRECADAYLERQLSQRQTVSL